MTGTNSLQGTFERDTLPHTIQYLAASNREGRLTLRSGYRMANVVFFDGNVVAANCEALGGETAIAELLAFPNGQFEFVQMSVNTVGLPSQHRISKSLSSLLMSAMVQRDTLDTRESKPAQPSITGSSVPTLQTPKDGVSVQLSRTAWMLMPRMDGQHSVSEIAQILQLNERTVILELESMLQSGLVQVTQRVNNAPEGLVEAVRRVVVQICGPMGSFVLDDVGEDLGIDLKALPSASIREFLTRIQAQMPPERQAAYANAINQVLKQFKLI
jgi:prepilin-type processing-associated H-X9-DG protein